MTKQLKKKIDNSLTSPWELTDSVLYKLCKKHPLHINQAEIIAKTILIGRTYAAALERNKKKEKKYQNEEFYTKSIANRFLNSKIDDWINGVRKIRKSQTSEIIKLLKVHKFLMTLLQKETAHGKRSFSSKYLHFHLPNLFFIYDSRAIQKIRKYVSRLDKSLYATIRDNKKLIDKEYAIFYFKCLKLQSITLKYRKLSPKQLDNFLIK